MEMLLYLAKVSICTGVFFLFYHFILSKFTFFNFNRWYLLITLTISFIIPVLTFQVERKVETPTVAVSQTNIAVSSNEASLDMDPEISFQDVDKINITLEDFLVLIYALGALCFSTRFINGLFQVIINGRNYAKNNGLRYVLVPSESKFKNSSFSNYLFIDENLDEKVREQVISHELVHLKKFHFVDKLLSNLSLCLLWFNPFAFAYLNAIDANHEFEVDAKSASNKFQKSEYAQLILHLAQNSNNLIIHNFSKLPLKRRIAMLFKKPTNQMKKIIYLSALPLVAACCLAFVNQKEVLVYVNSKSIAKPVNQKSLIKDFEPALAKQEELKLQGKSLNRMQISTIKVEQIPKATINGETPVLQTTNNTISPKNWTKVEAKQRVLVIDPGHGGEDKRSISVTGLLEKDLNLKSALILKEEAEKRGIKVVMTRDDDKYLTLKARVEMQDGADAFISVHHNSMPPIKKDGTPFSGNGFKGMQVYINEFGGLEKSKDLGMNVLKSLNNLSGFPVKDSLDRLSLYVLREAKIPSILVEFANISYKQDCDFISDEANLRRMCNLILDGYDQFGRIN